MSKIRRARFSDRDELAKMRSSLWPDGSPDELLSEIEPMLTSGMSGTLPIAILVAEHADGRIIGFIEAGLRSHADGCDPTRPVGFVEGWFVEERYRNRGVGRELMRAAENWARENGAVEMASDALVDNQASQLAHQSLGFEVVDRCVHFRKRLPDIGVAGEDTLWK